MTLLQNPFVRWLGRLLGSIVSTILLSLLGWWLLTGGGAYLAHKVGLGDSTDSKANAITALKDFAPGVYKNIPNVADPKITVEGEEVRYTWVYEGAKNKSRKVVLVMSKNGGVVRGLEVK